jgi:NAD(P)-dependent dehydrogenase (short-subunit alcohol dehydrogenase family)
VAVADLDGERAAQVAAAIEQRYPGRATGFATDCRQEDAIADAVQRTVLEYGGLDTLFYTPGLAPRFAPLSHLTRDDIQAQLDVHYIGALLAVRHAAAVMTRQGLGGSVICSVSKAALAPGREAAAYGGSKAGLQHALRTAALELGREGIRVNSINADQVETPLFLKFARARAAAKGITLEEQLAGYRDRNALGVSLIPARAVADLAVLLASERFRYTTGDIITIDGGLPDAFPR